MSQVDQGLFESHEDKSSLEAAAEAAAKVNAMLVAKGMLRPNQLQTGTKVMTKKTTSSTGLVVTEVEINNLTLQCRNTLTRGTTQEEISKASGASVTTRGRYIGPDDKARNHRDRNLYLNIQSSNKESVDIAVDKINTIIHGMNGNNEVNSSVFRPGKMRLPPNQNMSFRFPKHLNNPPPPLMSLPTPVPVSQHLSLPPPTQTITVLQEKLYIGLEHAPPNFDTKNKILGPGGSYLQHIQTETGASVGLRGKSSGFLDPTGADAFEPMHVHIEHPTLQGIQEAKKLAENLIQTVQQAYVSFQQALAAMPPSVPTGFFTGLPQQPPFVEPSVASMQPGIPTISAIAEPTVHSLQQQVQSLGAPTVVIPTGSLANAPPTLQPQAITNPPPGQTVVLPSNINLTTGPLVNQLPASAPNILQQPPPAPLELGAQQAVIISQQAPGQPPTHSIGAPVGLPHVVAPTPQPVPAPVPANVGPYVSPTVQLVSQAPPPVQPPIILQAPPPGPPVFSTPMAPTVQSVPMPISTPSSVVYTVASTSGHSYYTNAKAEEPKRRFTEEKDDNIPENLLGYQHGPPHLVNLVQSSPPPHSLPPPSSQPLMPALGGQLLQPPPPEQLILNHTQESNHFAHLVSQSSIIPNPNVQAVLQSPQMPPAHFTTHPPPVIGPPPSVAIQRTLTLSPSADNRSTLASPSTLMPPPPPPACIPNDNSNDDESASQFSNVHTSSGSSNGQKRRSTSPNTEPEKKKIKGILKNKQDSVHEEKEDRREETEEGFIPASPHIQGQPMRYPNIVSDPSLPPNTHEQSTFIAQQPQMPALPPGHHLIQQSDPNFPPHLHIPQPGAQMENIRAEAPTQLVLEHPGPNIHIAHHRAPTPAPIHVEHTPRHIFLEQPTHLHVPQQGHAPPEMYEFEVNTQQVPPAPLQIQNFEHVTGVPQTSQSVELVQQPPVSAVIVSSNQQYPPYSITVSSAPSTVPPVSFAMPSSSPFPVHSHSIQRPQETQFLISAPPPPFNVPNSSPQFQPQYSTQQPPPAPQHLSSRPPPHQPHQYQSHPQGMPY